MATALIRPQQSNKLEHNIYEYGIGVPANVVEFHVQVACTIPDTTTHLYSQLSTTTAKQKQCTGHTVALVSKYDGSNACCWSGMCCKSSRALSGKNSAAWATCSLLGKEIIR